MRHWTIVGLIVVLAGLFGATGGAHAQTVPVPPEHYTLDPRGVDLVTGDWMPVSGGTSIGSGSLALGYSRTLLQNGVWANGAYGGIYTCGIGVDCVVSIEGVTEVFSSPAAMVFTPKGDTGSSLVYNWGTDQFTYTRGDGTVFITERKNGSGFADGVVTRKTEPNGLVTTYNYKTETECVEQGPPDPELEGPIGPPGGCVTVEWNRLQSYQNTAGYMVHLDYASDDHNSPYWQVVSKATALNLAVDYCAPLATSCSYSRTWPSVTHAGSGDTDQSGRTTTYGSSGGLGTGIRYPGSVSDDVTVTYAGGGVKLFVDSVTDATGLWNYSFTDSGITRTAVVTGPLGQAMTVVSDLSIGRATSVTQTTTAGASPVTRTWAYQYDGEGRLTRITNPEGDYTVLAYDGRGNVTSTVAHEKPSLGSGTITTSATYASTCSNPVTCNKPTSTTDARGNVTDYVWNGTHGGLESVTAPAPSSGAVRPQTRIGYGAQTAYYKNSSGVIAAAPSSITLPTSTSTCATGTAPSCLGTTDETQATVFYGSSGVANNLLPTQITKGDGVPSGGGLKAVTTMNYTPVGDLQEVNGPLSGSGDVTQYRYDTARQLIGVVGPDPDAGGALLNRAQRMTYNARGQVTLTEAGTTPGYSDANWSSFNTLQRQATEYDSWGRPVVARSQDAAGNTLALQQVGYDAAGRAQCAATRMNPGTFSGLPGATNACSQTWLSSWGADRIVQMTYDAAGRPVSSTSGVGTGSAITESVSYSPNGKVKDVVDGNGGQSTYVYDGFDRLGRLHYPNATGGGVSSTDFDWYGYDAAGNVTFYQNRAGEAFTSTFDNLNRRTYTTAPSGSGTPNRGVEYDNLNRITSVWSPTGPVWGVYWGWDALGRKISEQVSDTATHVQSVVNYGYDAAGRRVWISWPDFFYASYEYNYGNDLTAIRENGNPSWALQTTAYDNLGRRIATGKGNGVVSSWSYDGIGRLASLSQDVAGTAQDLTLGFTYNPAGQIVSRSVSNNAYVYTPASTAMAYVNNMLNRLTSINGSAVGYDARGNITSAPGATYGYNAENQMTSALTASGSSGYAFDPTGRLYQAIGATNRRFLYDGQQVIAEYDGSGVIQNRYVPGLGLDDVVTSYDSGGNRTWLLSDERGSVVGLTNGSGVSTAINTYDEYGVPGASNAGRFQYTGQMWLPDAQLYHYRARTYAPQIGRFMQTDPIGYAAGGNLYAYVGGDPMNFTDPSGMVQRRGSGVWVGYRECTGILHGTVVTDENGKDWCDLPAPGGPRPGGGNAPDGAGNNGGGKGGSSAAQDEVERQCAVATAQSAALQHRVPSYMTQIPAVWDDDRGLLYYEARARNGAAFMNLIAGFHGVGGGATASADGAAIISQGFLAREVPTWANIVRQGESAAAAGPFIPGLVTGLLGKAEENLADAYAARREMLRICAIAEAGKN